MSLGIKGTYDKVMSANGPAQMLTYAFWSVLVAGMFYGVDPMCFPNWLIILWGAAGAAIVPVTIWCNKTVLKYTLLFDMILTAVIMAKFFMHEPHSMDVVYYSSSITGMEPVLRNNMHTGHSISEWFHGLALIWMSFHSLYLANLTHRQILEKKRFT